MKQLGGTGSRYGINTRTDERSWESGQEKAKTQRDGDEYVQTTTTTKREKAANAWTERVEEKCLS